ncbi:MAG TPA: acyltransferase family protein [Mycobacteriales bacterium]|nr:acyltransferase family protein [Mycobacteriales bacterium]
MTGAPDAAAAPPRRLTYVPALDGMRGISLPGTIYTHFQIFLGYLPTAPWWVRRSGPFALNIEMFFVLSGALITSLLVAEHQRSGSVSLSSFYLRRSRRLGPALLAVVPLLLISQYVLPGSSSQPLGSSPWATALLVLLFVGNWQLAAGGDIGWLGPAWTLGIEEQFYLTWPSVLRAAMRRRWGRQAIILGVCILVVLSSAVSAVLVASYKSTQVVYMTPAQVAPILIGCALGYTITTDPDGRLARLLRSPLAALVGLGGMVAISVLMDTHLTQLVSGGYALYGVAASLLIGPCMGAAAPERPTVWNKVLGWKPFVVIGQVSYEAYLVHCIVILAVLRVAPRMPVADMIVVDLALIAVISAVFYYLVEQPIRRFGWKAAFRPSAVAARRQQPKRRVARAAPVRGGAFVGAAAGVAVIVLAALAVATAGHNPPNAGSIAGAEAAVANVGLPPGAVTPGGASPVASPSGSGTRGTAAPGAGAGTGAGAGGVAAPGRGATSPSARGSGQAGIGALRPPTLISISPATGPVIGGTEVTLHGSGFVPDHTIVYFGSLAVSDISVINASTLRVAAPSARAVLKSVRSLADLHGLSTTVAVATPAGRSSLDPALQFTYI